MYTLCSSIAHSSEISGHMVGPLAATAAFFTQCFSNFIKVKATAQESY